MTLGFIDFLNYSALALLIFVPILILLYFLKLKRPQIKVASTLLWQKVLEDMRVNSPFQRLKKSLLLLIQLILLLLLIFALARPWLKSMVEKEESIIAVLDISASMGAKEGSGKTRLDIAKGMLIEEINQLHHDGEMMILTYDTRATITTSFTTNKKKLINSLKSVKTSDNTTDIGQALRIAQSLAKSRSNVRLRLLSDGGFPDPGKVEFDKKIEYTPIGSKLNNLAITQMNVRRSLRKPEEIELYVAVNNYSDEKMDGEMKLTLDKKLLDSKYFELDGGKSLSQVFRAELPGGGVFEVEFDTDDALKVDNRAIQIVPAPRKRNVLLVSENPFYIRRAMEAIRNVELVAIAPDEYPKFANEDFNTVIWSGVTEPQVGKGNNIYFGCFPKTEGMSVGSLIKSPDIADWDTTHPVNRFIDYSNLIVSEALKINFPKHAQILLSSSRDPLAAHIKQKERGLIICSFNVLKSSWPFQVTLLFFLRNCLDYFDAEHLATNNTNITVGSVLNVPFQEQEPVITAPDGKHYPMTPVTGGGFTFNGVNQCGIYEVTPLDTEGTNKFAANLFDRRESELTPIANPIADEKQLKILDASSKITREYFRELIMIAIAFLLLEWFIYHRRILN